MRNLYAIALIAIFTANMSFAEAIEHPRNLKEETRIHERAQKRWMWSAIAVTAASLVDAHSSVGKRELNGALRSADGTFGARGFGIKMGIVGGVLASQYVMVRKHPEAAKAMMISNYGMAGVKLGVAARNYQIERPAYLLRQGN
jgi:hypothetical protein